MYEYNYITMIVHSRVLKETMRGGGGNVTQTHAEDVSLCALFLMDASKKVDREFKARQSTAHTVRDADGDINKLTTSLLEHAVTSANSERKSPPFTDPTDAGHKKIATTSWVADTLLSTSTEDLQLEQNDIELADLTYELSDVM